MKLELTQEQLVIIWDEIIRIKEQELPLLYEGKDTWSIIGAKEKILILESIVENECIEI